MSRIVVTGALGNVGGAVASSLIHAGANVRLADWMAASLHDSFPEIDCAHLDFYDDTTFDASLEGVEKVFLIRPPAISRVGPTLNRYVDAAASHDVRHIVFSSVAGAESNWVLPHHRIERHIQRSGVPWTMLRPGFFSQNLATSYQRDIVEDDLLFVPAGHGQVAFLDARDIGDVAAEVITGEGHSGRGYHLTGPEALTFHEVSQLLSLVLGRSIRYKPATIPAYLRHLTGRDVPARQALVQAVLHSGIRRGDAAVVTDAVQRLLGRRPRTLRRYIEDHSALWM